MKNISKLLERDYTFHFSRAVSHPAHSLLKSEPLCRFLHPRCIIQFLKVSTKDFSQHSHVLYKYDEFHITIRDAYAYLKYSLKRNKFVSQKLT